MNSTNDTEQGGAPFNATSPDGPPKNLADTYISLFILIVTGIAVVVGTLYMCIGNKKLGLKAVMSTSSTFEPPVERAAYLEARAKLDAAKHDDLEVLRKLLMKRAIKAIPLVLSMQNEGNSIERLYKRGMLTDDMHFKVKDLKAFVDQEFQDVQFEADDLLEGWSQQIWSQAMQFHHMIQNSSGTKAAEEDESESKPEGEKRVKKKKAPSNEAVKKPIEPLSKEQIVEKAAAEEGVDPEVIRTREAEKVAKQLLAEEESDEKKKKAAKGKK
jgi:hypothetical protein